MNSIGLKLSDFPVEMVQSVLNHLSLKEQMIAAKVCRQFKEALETRFLGEPLAYGKRKVLRQVSAVRPQTDLYTEEGRAEIFGNKALFLNKGQKSVVIVDLVTKERSNIQLGDVQAKWAFLLSESNFALITEHFECRVYDIREGSLLSSAQLNIEQESRFLTICSGKIYFRTWHLQNYYIHNCLEGTTDVLLKVNFSGRIFSTRFGQLFKYLWVPTRSDDFDKGGGTKYWVDALNQESLNTLWTVKKEVSPVLITSLGVISDERVTIIAFLVGYSTMDFEVHDTTSGELKGKFSESYRSLSTTARDSFLNSPNTGMLNTHKFCWLTYPFFIIWVGRKLHVWDLDLKRQCTVIDLKGLCPIHELNDWDSHFCPVLDAAITENEVRLVLQNQKKELRHVRYSLKDFPSPDAVEELEKFSLREFDQDLLSKVEGASSALAKKE